MARCRCFHFDGHWGGVHWVVYNSHCLCFLFISLPIRRFRPQLDGYHLAAAPLCRRLHLLLAPPPQPHHPPTLVGAHQPPLVATLQPRHRPAAKLGRKSLQIYLVVLATVGRFSAPHDFDDARRQPHLPVFFDTQTVKKLGFLEYLMNTPSTTAFTTAPICNTWTATTGAFLSFGIACSAHFRKKTSAIRWSMVFPPTLIPTIR